MESLIVAGQEQTIGDRIRWTFERHLQVTQSEFARRLGVRQPQVSRWVNNPKSPPNESSLEAIADKAGVSLAWLRYGVGTPTGEPEAVEERPEDAVAGDPLEEWVRDFERRVRYGVGKIPGISDFERRARASDAIEAQIKALQMVGDPVPPRLFELREMLRNGEF